MSHRNKPARSGSGHRKYRQKLNLDGAVVAGDNRHGEVVYCYRFPSHPSRVKIGYSSRGLARIVEQSTAFPEKPEVIFVIHDRRAKTIETAFHEALAHKQADVMGTEWFEAGWDDFLKVSPILRKASRKQTGHRIRRFVGFLILATIGILLYPPLAMTQLAMADNIAPEQISRIWTSCFSMIASMKIPEYLNVLEYAGVTAWRHEMPTFLKAIPVMMSASIFLLPRLFRKRQAY
jgi:hypothetical protein